MADRNPPIEEGTRVIHGMEDTIRTIGDALYRTRNRWDACVDSLSPSLSAKGLKRIYLKAREKGVTVRYITEITKDNIDYCKEIMKFAELRHFPGIKGNFAVGDEEYVAGIREEADPTQFAHCIYSNVKLVVSHNRSIFEIFWQSATPAKSRIRELEEGITLSVMEIIQNPQESLRRAYSKVGSAKEQVLIMFSTSNAVRRHLHTDRLRAIKEAAEDENREVRMLVPIDAKARNKIGEIKSIIPQVKIRTIDERLKTKITILVIDRKESFIFETSDDAKEDPYEAIGRSAYSNSDAMGLSLASIFESIWNQSELYERLKEVDSMKDEFINIAAHELRTPVLPIVLGAENLIDRMPDDENVRVIMRNANRITKLTNDILDVSRIESKSFKMKKEKGDIKKLAEEAIQDAIFAMRGNKSQVVKVHLENNLPFERDVTFDNQRIRQVLTNLLDNAIKFTDQGTITVSVGQSVEDSDHLEIKVIDSGAGIHESIKDRLFEKFATKSEMAGGSGLGLYLSKAIVEAHGGKIWAKNNYGGRGATFAFTLPYTDKQE